ncbi:acyl-CoA dehydrogenase family protein [Paraburkholderia dinghuensis]|uniref:Acyl-CoA dehydrogenase n=1 Tax=Paraburkholderia dinghuensis TaxID=2305225 RepID=A0A3N6N9Z5_9BURK|nr:acyl-CoA dehydrogenase family protein [Paraburkholderia dinghuensis]RQH05067.1 acyl-CoA dehydrogenase [Paraburkholderia dinghuensis]
MKRTIFEAEHESFRNSVRRFVNNEIAPHVEAWRAQGSVTREAWRKAGEQSLLCMWAGEQYGGAGIEDFRYDQILAEELYLGGDPGFYIPLHNRIVAPYIQRFGNEEQRQRFLPGAISGETILAVAMTEPGAGSDLAGMKAHARDCGDYWLLNGSKTYISNGILADAVIVAARTNPESSHGLSLFIVERGMQGFERGRRLAKMGLDAQDTAELFFNDVKVPKANVLGEPGKGFVYLASNLAEERLMCAVQSLAHAQAAFDLTLDFVKQRRAFGRPIGALQNTRFKMAEMRAQLDCQQVWVDQLVLLHNEGKLDAVDASSAKLLATELEGRVIDECVQLHGGAGFMEEYRISRMYRDARVTRIFAGTNEIMKEIIGRSLGLDERKLT